MPETTPHLLSIIIFAYYRPEMVRAAVESEPVETWAPDRLAVGGFTKPLTDRMRALVAR